MSTTPESELDKRLRYVEKKDVAVTANRIVEKCFDKCISTLRSKHLGDGEIECVQNCTSKYLELTNRMYARFQDIQKQNMETKS